MKILLLPSLFLVFWGGITIPDCCSQVASDLKIAPFYKGYVVNPTLIYERFSTEHRTSWEAGLIFNRLFTRTKPYTTYGGRGEEYYNYLGGYAAWRWYPFSKPGKSRWLFLGGMCAYGGGVFLPSKVRNYFNIYGSDPDYAGTHHQRQLYLGPLIGVKLMEGKRVSLEGQFALSPYYKKVSSRYDAVAKVAASYGVNLGYRIYHHNHLKRDKLKTP